MMLVNNSGQFADAVLNALALALGAAAGAVVTHAAFFFSGSRLFHGFIPGVFVLAAVLLKDADHLLRCVAQNIRHGNNAAEILAPAFNEKPADITGDHLFERVGNGVLVVAEHGVTGEDVLYAALLGILPFGSGANGNVPVSRPRGPGPAPAWGQECLRSRLRARRDPLAVRR